MPNEDGFWKGELEEILRTILSEENTDQLIDLLLEKLNLPWWLPEGIIRRVLDQLLPDVLLNAILEILPDDES